MKVFFILILAILSITVYLSGASNVEQIEIATKAAEAQAAKAKSDADELAKAWARSETAVKSVGLQDKIQQMSDELSAPLLEQIKQDMSELDKAKAHNNAETERLLARLKAGQ